MPKHPYHREEHDDSCHIDDNLNLVQRPTYEGTGHIFHQLHLEDIRIDQLRGYNRIL